MLTSFPFSFHWLECSHVITLAAMEPGIWSLSDGVVMNPAGILLLGQKGRPGSCFLHLRGTENFLSNSEKLLSNIRTIYCQSLRLPNKKQRSRTGEHLKRIKILLLKEI